MIITYKEESITTDLLDEAEPLLKATAEETGQLSGTFEVNRMLYIKLSQAGVYKSYIARDENGKMVGYIGYSVMQHLYYKDHVMAQQDVLHLDKDYRKGLTGIKLIKFGDSELEKLGVTVIVQNSTNKKEIGKVFERMGYKESDKLYIKELINKKED